MDRDVFIFKRLKEHYNFINDKYEIVGIFLQGSQNYDLDVYDDDYQSDIDSKAIVLPNLDDILENKQPLSIGLTLDNNEHIDVKDIRVMFDKFVNQDINYIEILFTKFRIINPKYKALFQTILDNKEAIARMDIVRALNRQIGMSKQKLDALKHPYPTTLPKINKYGYDPKQLHHILRINDFAKKYISGKPYQECLIPDNKEYLIKIKKGVLPLHTAEDLAVSTDNETYKLIKQAIKDIDGNNIDVNCLNVLSKVSASIIKQYVSDSFKTKEDEPKDIFMPQNIFVTSDNHFYHGNIISFEHRPFTSVEDMNKKMIQLWNETVSNDDLVYILGDLSYGSPSQTNELLKQLNGKKILIIGNHDVFIESKKFDKSLFLDIDYCKKIKYKNHTFYLCHYPFASNDTHAFQLYGHLHSNPIEDIHYCDTSLLPKNSYNVGADVHNFKPINIKEILAKLKEQT